MSNLEIQFYIIVPVYKAEKFIDRCISSVYNQSYKNWKLILVDDGSPDKSGEICDRYSTQDKNIITIHQENKGQIAARTAGNKYILDNLQPNSFVVYLDSDDTLEDNALETIKNTIERDNSDMVIFKYQRVYPNGKINQNVTDIHTGVVSDKRELYKIVFSSPYYNSLCIKSFSTNLIEKDVDYSKYYSLRHGEDLLQSVYYYKHCRKVSFIGSILYNYSYNDNSVTSTITYENYELDTSIRRYILEFLKSEKLWNSKDYREYSKAMQRILDREIKLIAHLNTSKENKITLYKKIDKDLYWKEILSYGTFSSIVLLFKLRLYKLIFLIIYLYNKIYKRV